MENVFSKNAASRSVVTGDAERRYRNIAAALFCLAVSFVTMMICTRSSFLYPLNDWVDSNCYFTVGKSMMNGKVVYRDIYEQKGVLLYLIHGIGYLFSHTSFIGVFAFEVVFFGAFLYLCYLCASLFVNYLLSLSVLPVIAYSLMTSISIRQGDSAEEFCLPFIMLPIYLFLKSVKEGDGSGVPSKKEVFLLGMGAACILWIKYTMLGIYIGYVLCAVILLAGDGKFERILECAVCFIAGAAVISAPILLYFAVNGAIGDMWEVYFYNNMFLYTDERELVDKLAGIASLAVRGLSYNENWGWMVYLGFFSLVLDFKKPRLAAGAALMYIGSVFFIYWGGIGWYYYSFGMAALSVPGFIFLARCINFSYETLKEAALILISRAKEKRAQFASKMKRVEYIFDAKTRRTLSYIVTAAIVVCLGVNYASECYRDSPNVFYMKYEREEIWQEKFAKIINESDEKTLLNYSCLDLGVYTTADIVPEEKYFVRLNIQTDEMNESLDSAISEQRPRFVVYRGAPSQFVLTYYEVVAREESHLEFEGSSAVYYLLERRNVG